MIMKKILHFFVLCFLCIAFFSSCGIVLNLKMDDLDPPKIIPEDIHKLNDSWYIYGYYGKDGNLYVDRADIDWTSSKNAKEYEIYYYSSPTAISHKEAFKKSYYFGTEKDAGEYTISFRDKDILLDYYNNYTYIFVIPVAFQYLEGKGIEIKNKGSPLTGYWAPYKLK